MADDTSHETGKPGGKSKANMKLYIGAGIAAVVVLVFFFVHTSNQNASGSNTSTTGSGLDPTTQALLENALAGQGMSGSQVAGPQGPAGPAGPAGPIGLTGPQGPSGIQLPWPPHLPKSPVGQTAGTVHNWLIAAGYVPRDAHGAIPGEANWKVTSITPGSGNQVFINAVR